MSKLFSYPVIGPFVSTNKPSKSSEKIIFNSELFSKLVDEFESELEAEAQIKFSICKGVKVLS